MRAFECALEINGGFFHIFTSVAEKALPAIILELVARIGEEANKRITLPCSILRVDPKDPSEAALKKGFLNQVRRYPEGVRHHAGRCRLQNQVLS